MVDEARFWSRVKKSDDCWLWTGSISSTGYGRYGKLYAHRISHELHIGPIPDGLHVDHLCRNTRCVNPAHLEAVTQRENMLRGVSPGANAVRTNRCIYGHEFTPENTYIRPDGSARQCRACIRRRSQTLSARRRQTDLEVKAAAAEIGISFYRFIRTYGRNAAAVDRARRAADREREASVAS